MAFVLFVIAIFLEILIVTISKDGDLQTLMSNYGIMITAALFILTHPKDIKIILGIIRIMAYAIVIANLVLVLLYPEGLYVSYDPFPMWLSGNKNAMPTVCALFCLFCLMHSAICDKSIGMVDITMIGISLYISIAVNSITTCVSLIIAMVFYLLSLYNIFRINRIFTLFGIFIASLVASIGVALLNVQSNILFVRYLIENVLHRDVTMTTRTDIWTRALLRIEKSPYLGLGNEYSVLRINLLGYDSTHNGWIEIIYLGGFVCLFLYIALLIYVDKCSLKLKNTYMYSCVLSFSVFVALRFISERPMHGAGSICVIIFMAIICCIAQNSKAAYIACEVKRPGKKQNVATII
ncbi:MAG: O-antigen ligase family protein [Acidobacteriota bacterium]|jgi:O-antigen ligase|nr:O-antigen ligase family protein [Acidobacteriota bacterium]